MYHDNQSAKVPHRHTIHIKYVTAATVRSNNAIYRGGLPVPRALLSVFSQTKPNDSRRKRRGAGEGTWIQSRAPAERLPSPEREQKQSKPGSLKEEPEWMVQVPCSGAEVDVSDVLLRREENRRLPGVRFLSGRPRGRVSVDPSVRRLEESCRVVVLMAGRKKNEEEEKNHNQT